MKIRDLIKKNDRFILFVIILLTAFFLSNILKYHFDATWEYGMSHAIRMGEVPYRDFNTVSTPLFIFIMSIGLFIYDSFWTFIIEGFILHIVVFYFVNKAYQKNALFYIVSICFCAFSAFVPTYNSLAFSLLILLLCFEKLGYSDKIIGLFWGFLILAKHTIGIPIILFVIIGLFIKKENRKRMLERISFMLIPLTCFFLYLLLNNCIYQFFDLCVFGLFSFASKNTISNFAFISGILFLASLYGLIKHKKEIDYYYMLPSITFVIPIFDMTHFSYYLSIFVLVLFSSYFYKDLLYKVLSYAAIILTILVIVLQYHNYKYLTISTHDHYKGFPTLKIIEENNKILKKHTSKYDHYYIIDMYSMHYDIALNRKITYYDVLLDGNYGYNGDRKLIERIESEKDCYFIMIDHIKDYKIGQFRMDVVEYIESHYPVVETFNGFSVYYKEK